MGYWTYFTGEMKIELPKKQVDVINLWIKIGFSHEPKFSISETSLFVEDEWKNGIGYIEDILLFIEKNGKLISGEIYCSGEEENDKKYLVVHDGYLKKKVFDYAVEDSETLDTGKLITLLKGEDYLRNFRVNGIISNETIEEIFENWNSEMPETVSADVEKVLHELSQTNEFKIELFLTDIRIEWTKDWIVKIPFKAGEMEALESGILFKLPFEQQPKLMDYEWDEQETRTITVDGSTVVLFEPLMYLTSGDEPSMVQLEDGTFKEACSMCIHRLRKETGLCNPCTPQKTKTKEINSL